MVSGHRDTSRRPCERHRTADGGLLLAGRFAARHGPLSRTTTSGRRLRSRPVRPGPATTSCRAGSQLRPGRVRRSRRARPAPRWPRDHLAHGVLHGPRLGAARPRRRRPDAGRGPRAVPPRPARCSAPSTGSAARPSSTSSSPGTASSTGSSTTRSAPAGSARWSSSPAGMSPRGLRVRDAAPGHDVRRGGPARDGRAEAARPGPARARCRSSTGSRPSTCSATGSRTSSTRLDPDARRRRGHRGAAQLLPDRPGRGAVGTDRAGAGPVPLGAVPLRPAPRRRRGPRRPGVRRRPRRLRPRPGALPLRRRARRPRTCCGAAASPPRRCTAPRVRRRPARHGPRPAPTGSGSSRRASDADQASGRPALAAGYVAAMTSSPGSRSLRSTSTTTSSSTTPGRSGRPTRPIWEESVRDPMLALTAALAEEFGEAKVFRPYRDVRFAKDKTPYKNHQGAFVAAGPATGWYVQVGAPGVRVGAGFYDAGSARLGRDPRRDRRRPHRAGARDGPARRSERRGWERGGDTLQDHPARLRRRPPADRPAPAQVASRCGRSYGFDEGHPHPRAPRPRYARTGAPPARSSSGWSRAATRVDRAPAGT